MFMFSSFRLKLYLLILSNLGEIKFSWLNRGKTSSPPKEDFCRTLTGRENASKLHALAGVYIRWSRQNMLAKLQTKSQNFRIHTCLIIKEKLENSKNAQKWVGKGAGV